MNSLCSSILHKERLEQWNATFKIAWLYSLIPSTKSMRQKAYTEKQANKAEQAASMQDMQTLYRIAKTKIPAIRFTSKDITGNVLSKEEATLKGWKDHFEEVFNMEDPNEADITPAVNILDISRDPPSIDEGKIATAKL